MEASNMTYFPLGTVVQLKHGDAKLVINNRLQMVENKNGIELYDYMASIFPIGLEVQKIYYFNNKDIDKVVFTGYVDDVEREFQDDLKKWLKENRDSFTEGKTILLKKNNEL